MHIETRFEARLGRTAGFVPALLVAFVCLTALLSGCGGAGSGLFVPPAANTGGPTGPTPPFYDDRAWQVTLQFTGIKRSCELNGIFAPAMMGTLNGEVFHVWYLTDTIILPKRLVNGTYHLEATISGMDTHGQNWLVKRVLPRDFTVNGSNLVINIP